MNSNVNIKCMICKKRFPEPLFNVHQCSRSRTGAKSYDCDICEKTFPERNGLAYHKRTHTGKNHMNVKIVRRHLVQVAT